MTMVPIPAVALTPVAYFPENYFLENLVVRADGSVLVTTVLQKECWSPRCCRRNCGTCPAPSRALWLARFSSTPSSIPS
jgi:hypothetical protein